MRFRAKILLAVLLPACLLVSLAIVFAVRKITVDSEQAARRDFERTQRFVRITVKDTGDGLFGDARIRACDPFFSTRESGAGLGLTSVAMIVRGFQGWLHIESSESGTSIHISLPALTAAG